MLLPCLGVTDFKAVKDSSTSEAPQNSSSLPLIISSVCGAFILCASTLCVVITCRRQVLDTSFHFKRSNSLNGHFPFHVTMHQCVIKETISPRYKKMIISENKIKQRQNSLISNLWWTSIWAHQSRTALRIQSWSDSCQKLWGSLIFINQIFKFSLFSPSRKHPTTILFRPWFYPAIRKSKDFRWRNGRKT